MLIQILTWTAATIAVTVLLLMALGPTMVDVDSWWSERQSRRKTPSSPAG
jgi:hypothetical protein